MKYRRIIVSLAVALLATGGIGESQAQSVRLSSARSKPVALDWFLDSTTLWETTPEQFNTQFSKKFVWLDKEKTRARFNPDRHKFVLRGNDVGETLVSFKAGKLAGVSMSVLNKGDDGYIKRDPFLKGVTDFKSVVGSVAGVPEEPRKKDETLTKADGAVWRSKKAFYMLEWLWVPERKETIDDWILTTFAHGEFVRLRMAPPLKQLGVQMNTVRTSVNRGQLAQRVKREGTKVWVDGVPMVDQGSKGYCAVAAFERVMRYFGSEIDMHDLADLAKTSGGTNPDEFRDAFLKMARRTGSRSREVFFLGDRQYVTVAKDYNKEAKKMGRAGMDSAEIKSTMNQEGVLGLYRAMDPEILKKARSNDANFSKFAGEIRRAVDSGVPLMWAVQLGVFWEEKLEDSWEAERFKDDEEDEGEGGSGESAPPKPAKPADEDSQASRAKRPPEWMSGGHMRLIVGYDPKEKVIFYSDSWGPGHEMKKMPLEEAWAITNALFVLEPQ